MSLPELLAAAQLTWMSQRETERRWDQPLPLAAYSRRKGVERSDKNDSLRNNLNVHFGKPQHNSRALEIDAPLPSTAPAPPSEDRDSDISYQGTNIELDGTANKTTGLFKGLDSLLWCFMQLAHITSSGDCIINGDVSGNLHGFFRNCAGGGSNRENATTLLNVGDLLEALDVNDAN
jgi:hypothetical protein